MGHTNETVNVGLPQFISTDKPTWLGDVNGAFQKIDTEFGNVNATATGAEATANAAAAAATNAVATANAASAAAGNAETDAASANALATEAIGTANNAQSTAVLAKNTADAASATANAADAKATEALAQGEHGIFEKWKNAAIGSNFAAQTITITDIDPNTIDAIIIAFEESKDERYGAQWREFDKDVLNSPSIVRSMSFLQVSNTGVNFYTRTVTLTLNGTTLSIEISDGTIYTYPFAGTGETSTTNNGILIPVRILALVHNE